ncbi:trigger factor, partial [Psittacicella hinzii]
MSFTVLSKDGLIREVEFSVSSSDFQAQYLKNLKKLASSPSFKLQGFRPGKVPLNVAEPYLSREATNKAVEFFEQNSLADYSFQTKEINLIVLSRAANWAEDGSALKYTLKFEVAPTVLIKDLKETEVEFPVVDEEKAVEEMILALRTQRSTYETVEKEAEVDDLVVFDVVATDENGLEFAPFTGERSLVVGSYQFPSEFSGEFVGRKAGDEFETSLRFTEDKDYNVKVKVKEVKLRHLGEVDEAFINEFISSKANPTLDDLKAEIKKNLDREIKINTVRFFLNKLNEKLTELYADLELPENLVEFYVYRRFESFIVNTQPKGKKLSPQEVAKLTREEMDKFKDTAEVLANEERDNLRIELVQTRYIQEHGIVVSQEDLDQYIEEVSIMFENPAEYRKQAYENAEFLQAARNEIIAQKVAELF